MVSVETALADHFIKFEAIMAKLDKLANGSSVTMEGPKPLFESSSTTNALPHMDLPSFEGTNPLAWLAQAEQYSLVHKTATEQKVQLALIAMSGNAMFWAQWVLRRAALISWTDFSKELVARFGDSSAVNAYSTSLVK